MESKDDSENETQDYGSEIQEIQEEGNTIPPPKKRKRSTPQSSPAKRWCFTLNNYILEDGAVFEQAAHAEVPKLIYQSEVGENGTPHFQGYLEFAKKMRPLDFYANLLGHKRTSWRVAKGTQKQNIAYCSKEDTWDGKFRYQRGFPKGLVLMVRSDMRDSQLAIADTYLEDEDEKFGREIHWYWEEEGGWGKSILCKYMVDQMGAVLLGGANKDALYGIAGYVDKNGAGPKIVIFDIPRVNKGGVSYQSLEYIKNGCFFNSKYESGMVRFNSPHVLVFANAEPEYDKLSADRWAVKQLKKSPDSEANARQLDIELSQSSQ